MDVLGRANIRDTVSFSLYAKTQVIVGIQFENCKILAILDAESAKYCNVDPAALHANVYGTLPPGVPTDPDAFGWLKIQLQNGTVTAIGIPYIIPETMVVQNANTTAFYVENTNQDIINEIIKAIATTGNKVSKIVTI